MYDAVNALAIYIAVLFIIGLFILRAVAIFFEKQIDKIIKQIKEIKEML